MGLSWGVKNRAVAEADIRIFCLTAEPGSFGKVSMKLTMHGDFRIEGYWWWHNLLKEACCHMLDILASEATPSQVGAFLSALRIKGETVDEICGAAQALKSRLTPLQLNNNLINLDRDDINLEAETILATSETRDREPAHLMYLRHPCFMEREPMMKSASVAPRKCLIW